MANERLTDQTEFTGKPDSLDVIHLVDVSNTTDNAAGSSRKINVGNLLKGRTFVPLLGCLVYQVSATPSTTQIEDGDYIIYMTDTELIIGKALATILTIPADLRDNTKCANFLDASPAL